MQALQLLNSLESTGYDVSKEQSKDVVVYNSKQVIALKNILDLFYSSILCMTSMEMES